MDMDNYLFRWHLDQCKSVEEKTTYLEIFNYTDPAYNSCEDHSLLTEDDFENFLAQTGTFAPQQLKEGVKLQDGIRLIIQKDASHANTFAPDYISLTRHSYESMMTQWRLPFRAIEGSSIVGPFFWCSHDQDKEDRHLQIIFRKSDVRKKGKTRGWEIMLSYSYKTRITSGFVKGTESSDIVKSLKHLAFCRAEVGHPLLLPIIILSHDLSAKGDKRQRDARDWLRRLENAITMRNEIDAAEVYSDFDVDGINRDLVECHSQVLWKRPQAYQEIIKEIKEAMRKFMQYEPEGGQTEEIRALHDNMLSRLDFYRVKLTGMEHYIHTTLERLHIQRQALYNIMAQKESKLNLEIASQQRRVAHATKRDGTAMKTLSLLGAVFLPGTFMASVFSMTFFNFKVGSDSGGDSGESEVSSELWVYFAVTVPLTFLIVLVWWIIDHRRERKYAEEDIEIEKGIDTMEKDILAIMRKKTINKASTWNSAGQPMTLELAKREKLATMERGV
ncbi:uncharacterized protein F4812DRAFT_430692 [Daldinia caldariorum]|uniref:uncharacterized protein n=1 Tax=Daldinia caldariorum TaxID=326644 RepID=UPI002007A231|nr:uncharacterized protein F4812DRAFT_430692 [Daldinia caldariorum]KAI1466992.1 hypothetical protein F4812DRAFT_430692 [Daldinia caldariorum]